MALIHSGSLAALAAAIGLYAAPVFGLSGRAAEGCSSSAASRCSSPSTRPASAVGKWVQNGLTALKVGGLAVMTVLLYSRGSMDRLWSHWAPAPEERRAEGCPGSASAWRSSPCCGPTTAGTSCRSPPARSRTRRARFRAASSSAPSWSSSSTWSSTPPTTRCCLPRASAAATAWRRSRCRRPSDRAPRSRSRCSSSISILGAMNGITLGAARVSYAMAARRTVLPLLRPPPPALPRAGRGHRRPGRLRRALHAGGHVPAALHLLRLHLLDLLRPRRRRGDRAAPPRARRCLAPTAARGIRSRRSSSSWRPPASSSAPSWRASGRPSWVSA